MTQHKWHKEIKAWADGAEIEQRCHAPSIKEIIWSDWEQFDGEWTEEKHWEYRIKPQPKDLPDCVKTWLSMGATMEEIEKAVVNAIDKQFPTQPKEPQYLYVFFNRTTKALELDNRKVDLDYLTYVGKIPLETDNGTNE